MTVEAELPFFLFRNPKDVFEFEPTFLILEYYMIFLFILTFIHAVTTSRKNVTFWLTTIAHGLFVECVSYFVPMIDNFWHAQSTMQTTFGRLPVYIICLYAVFIYTSHVAINRLHLDPFIEAFATGLAVLIIDLPYDHLGAKMLWWIWHDTDINIAARNYYVPWNSYFFHITFASSACLIFNFIRVKLISKNRDESGSLWKELLCILITACTAMPLGCVQMGLNSLHFFLDVPGHVVVLIGIGIYCLIIFYGRRWKNNTENGEWRKENNLPWYRDIILWIIIIHFVIMMGIATFGESSTVRATGLHEQVGNCVDQVAVPVAPGLVKYKRKFLCLKDYDEPFDFSCVKNPPKDGDHWYTACGWKYNNYWEHLTVVYAYCLMGLIIFYSILRGKSEAKLKKQ